MRCASLLCTTTGWLSARGFQSEPKSLRERIESVALVLLVVVVSNQITALKNIAVLVLVAIQESALYSRRTVLRVVGKYNLKV